MPSPKTSSPEVSRHFGMVLDEFLGIWPFAWDARIRGRREAAATARSGAFRAPRTGGSSRSSPMGERSCERVRPSFAPMSVGISPVAPHAPEPLGSNRSRLTVTARRGHLSESVGAVPGKPDAHQLGLG
jgi:hypothetical protein